MWGGRVIRAHVRPAGQRARRRGVVSVRAQPPGAGARVGSSTFPACAANTAASRPTEQASDDAEAPRLPRSQWAAVLEVAGFRWWPRGAVAHRFQVFSSPPLQPRRRAQYDARF